MKRLIVSLGTALFVAGCFPTLETTPEQVEAEVSSALRPGASSEAIEAFLKAKGLEFSYDQHTNSYRAIIRHPESNFHAISIQISVDDQKRYLKVEASDSYTFL